MQVIIFQMYLKRIYVNMYFIFAMV